MVVITLIIYFFICRQKHSLYNFKKNLYILQKAIFYRVIDNNKLDITVNFEI